MVTPEQIRAARAMLAWTQQEFSDKSDVSLSSIKDFESGSRKTISRNVDKLQTCLETAGVEFIPENGGGAGVRLKR